MDTSKTTLNAQPKSVLILDLAKYFGGGQVRVIQLAKMLQSMNYPFCVVVLDKCPMHLKLLEYSLSVKSVSYSRGDPRLILALKKIIKEGGFQIVDTHNPQAHLWGLLTAIVSKNIRVVTTVHGCYGDAEKGWRSVLYNWVVKLNRFYSDKQFIAVSDSVQKYLTVLQVAPEAISYIPNAILPDDSISDVSIQKLTGWSNDIIVVAIAARLEPVKGINHLIAAMAKAVKINPLIKLFIMGEGREKDALLAQVEELRLTDSVYFAGFRQDVSLLLKSVDVFCLASLSEGLPFALLEAATAKLPLVLSEVGGMAEFFEHDYSALMFPSGDEEMLSKHILLLAGNVAMRERLGNAAYQTVEKNFSVGRLLAETIAVYNS